MSFKENAYQQISIADSYSGFTAREKKGSGKIMGKDFCR